MLQATFGACGLVRGGRRLAAVTGRRQAFLAIQAIDALFVDVNALAPQQDMDALVTVAYPAVRQFSNLPP